jgi:PTS system glucose-specific IIB component
MISNKAVFCLPVTWQAPCGLARLRVTVKDLNKVDSQAIQQEGALGVIIIGQQVHAIFGRQSDALRQLLDEHFSGRK